MQVTDKTAQIVEIESKLVCQQGLMQKVTKNIDKEGIFNNEPENTPTAPQVCFTATR